MQIAARPAENLGRKGGHVAGLRAAGIPALMLILSVASAPAAIAATCPDVLASAIPLRPSGAPGGAGFSQEILGLSGAERESKIVAELKSGNIPRRLRHLEPVTLRAESA